MRDGAFIYILTNQRHTTLYVGVTAFLKQRVFSHKTHFNEGSFTARYNLEKLVYYEIHPTVVQAIAREKELKAGSRKRKEKLINSLNPTWKDLYYEI